MSSLSESSLRKIDEAALRLFARHGFQRTSMADVAREAGISRATLYLGFSDKTALFARVAQSLTDNALAAARAAWRDGAALADNIEAVLLAKDLPLFTLLHASPHGAELLAVDADLTRAHGARLIAGFRDLLAAHAAALAGVDLGAFGGAEGFAAFLTTTGAGLKHEAASEADYRAAVRRLAVVAARATKPESITLQETTS